MATWHDLISPYRESQNPGAIYLLISDKRLIRLAMAWVHLPRLLAPPPEGAELADLWKAVKIDYPALGEASGLAPSLVLSGMEALKVHKVIFPDGSVHKSVSNIVGGLAAVALKVKQAPAPKAPAKGPEGQILN